MIDRLEGVPDEKRTARFVCAISAALPSGEVLHSQAAVEGIIGYESRGRMDLDMIPFLPPGIQVHYRRAVSGEEE